MRRYLATDGFTGACPEWYAVFQAAKYLEVAPWELLAQPIWYQGKALIAISAENAAQKIKSKQMENRK